jgi:DNA ligase-1
VKAFAELYAALDGTTKTTAKVEAMARYFVAAEPADAAWAIFFLSGRKLRQVVPSRKLASWAIELAGIEPWLFEECYDAVGDLAEAIALLLPSHQRSDDRALHRWVSEVLLPLREQEEQAQKRAVLDAWAGLDRGRRFVWNKLITGELRVGVSQQLLTRALAEVSGLDATTVAHRLMGAWEPTPEFYQSLLSLEGAGEDLSRPYPYFLASPLEGGPEELGPMDQWQAEWKWDGIRSQLVRRGGRTFLWTRGEELVTDRYPEIAAVGDTLPDGTAVDGEILPWRDGAVMPFSQLQKRIGRKSLGKKLLAEVPVVLMAYDLLEWQGEDVRERPLRERRRLLESLVREGMPASPLVSGSTWEELEAQRQASRERNVEGLMLKRLDSPYRVGRVRGDWWKWKIHPLTIDAVLVYAQRGSGKRASLYTDYTFAVWDGAELTPVAKAYSGLTDEEIKKVDEFVRRHTVEAFGPVRSVKPELVFELAFEGIGRSTRHKSGVAVRFPRILRWRQDKAPKDADTIESVRRLLPPDGGPTMAEAEGEEVPVAPPPRALVQGELFG